MLADDEAESLVEFLPWRLLEDDWLQVMEEWQIMMMMRLRWTIERKEEHERIKSMEREEEEEEEGEEKD